MKPFDTLGAVDSSNLNKWEAGQTLQRLEWISVRYLEEIIKKNGQAAWDGTTSELFGTALVWMKFEAVVEGKQIKIVNHSLGDVNYVKSMTAAKSFIRNVLI